MAAAVVIQTKGLVKQFRTARGTVDAVDGVTLQVRQGETYGLIGPDGAGKTTTLRVLLGLLKRTAGESTILGYDSMRETYPIRERVGYIAQQFALPPDMTVMENMRFFADVHCVDRADQQRRIPELLAFAGLAPYTQRLAGHLSGGMKKKLALACSLIHQPQVLILDEPTLGVDPVSRREFWNLLGNLRAEQGLTIMVCTPYMDEAERCNWVGLIYQGRLIAHDAPQTIKRMVPGQLLACTPSDLARAEQVVAGLPGTLEVQTYGAALHVFVDRAAQRQTEIETALRAAGVSCRDMHKAEVRMEEAFIHLIRRQRREETRQSPREGGR
ncbi:MAG: ABC transporter ATP-binding protein [Anaerolineae bacterium]|nr:ABC transporter ATP-binding protein [Anaerolineae bacterium]